MLKMISLKESKLDSDLEEETVNDFIFEGVQGDIRLKNVTFENCLFKNVNFNNVIFDGVDLIDVRFENCDLSNKSFDERLISECEFLNCKLVGSSFIDGFIKKTKFIGVSARYVNMSSLKLNDVEFNDSDFSDSTFIECDVKKLCLFNVNFTGSEILKTPLKNVDFSTSNITNVFFDVMSVRGMIVDSFQCPLLVGMLGVKVKNF